MANEFVMEAVRLTNRESVEAVLQEMTLDEKLYMLTGGSGFGTCAVPRLGIPAAMMVDSAAGVNLAQYCGDLYSRVQIREGRPFKSLAGVTNTETMGALLTALSEGKEPEGELKQCYREIQEEQAKISDKFEFPTCFPTGMLLGSTWSEEAVEACGAAVGNEANSLGVNVLLGSPDANIQRDPRGGRVFECYTEDPCLMSCLAPAMVRGVQSAGVFANAKHYAANNQETARLSVDENVSERALREIYLPGFRACVEDGGLKSMMCGYNRINGVGCSMNHWLIHDVLRNEWGFDGAVMSDWGGVYDQVEAVRAGNDLDMPGVRDMEPVRQAVMDGSLAMEDVDTCVRNVLNFIVDNPSFHTPRPPMNREKSREAAYNAAAEGFVLLKNNGVLPMKKDCRIALFGAGSQEFIMTSRQSSRVFSYKKPRLGQELSERCGAQNIIEGAVLPGTDYVILTLQSEGTEGRDRRDMLVDAEQHKMLMQGFNAAKEAGVPAILLLNIAAPVDIRDYLELADAILAVYYPGIEGARALADVLFGDISPSGHLSITYPKRVEDCPAYGFFPGLNHLALYNEDIYVGYRYYDLRDVEPLFPFGYGLSYTQFKLSNLYVDSACVDQDVQKDFRMYVDVENCGAFDGRAVVQVYLRHASETLVRPLRELKSFQKVFLKKGEKRTLEFRISVVQMAAFDPRFKCWVTERGIYSLEVGWDSRDLPLHTDVQITGSTIYDYGKYTPIRQIMADDAAYGILKDTFAPFGVKHADFADCLKYFPDKELGVVVDELIINKLLKREDEALSTAICRLFAKLKDLQPPV